LAPSRTRRSTLSNRRLVCSGADRTGGGRGIPHSHGRSRVRRNTRVGFDDTCRR
jgi:hypothetical protein